MKAIDKLDYSFDSVRDYEMTPKVRALHIVLAVFFLCNSCFIILTNFRQDGFDFDFFIGFLATAVLFGFMFIFIRRNQDKTSRYQYLRVENDELVYRWGWWQQEQHVNLTGLDYAVYSSTELILRFFDGREIIINSVVLTNNTKKFVELKNYIEAYIDEKRDKLAR